MVYVVMEEKDTQKLIWRVIQVFGMTAKQKQCIIIMAVGFMVVVVGKNEKK